MGLSLRTSDQDQDYLISGNWKDLGAWTMLIELGGDPMGFLLKCLWQLCEFPYLFHAA